MQNRDDDWALGFEPDDVVTLATVDANIIRQAIEHLPASGSSPHSFATRLDLAEICLGLIEAPPVASVAPDAAQILFGGKREAIGRHRG